LSNEHILAFVNLEVDDVDVMILPHGFCFGMDHVDHDVAMIMMMMILVMKLLGLLHLLTMLLFC
jgi:hypothetical protein